MPLGDLASTFLTLVISAPEIHWLFEYQVDDHIFTFDNQPVMEQLDGVPLTEPIILNYIRELIEGGVHSIQPVTSMI